MGSHNSAPGFNWTPEYQVSALPWVTGSLATSTTPRRVKFHRVTQYVIVRPDTENLRVGFSVNGVNGSNYYTVVTGTTERFDIRVKEMFIRTDANTGTADIFAGVTMIVDGIPFLTGSNELPNSPGSNWPGIG